MILSSGNVLTWVGIGLLVVGILTLVYARIVFGRWWQ